MQRKGSNDNSRDSNVRVAGAEGRVGRFSKLCVAGALWDLENSRRRFCDRNINFLEYLYSMS